MTVTRLMRGAFFVGMAGVMLLLERRRRARAYVERPSTHTGRNLVVAGLAAATVQVLEAPIVVPLSSLTADRRSGVVFRLRGPSCVPSSIRDAPSDAPWLLRRGLWLFLNNARARP